MSFVVGLAYAAYIRSFGAWNQGLPWERSVMIALHHQLPWAIDQLMLVFPWFGTNITLIPGVGLLAWWLWRRAHRKHLAMQLIVAQVGSYLLNPSLKALFDRSRPTLFERRGWYGFSSYPSGHSIASVSVVFTAAIMLHRAKGWKWPYWAAWIIALASIYSRVYLAVHWPTDVIGGTIVGLVWLAVTVYAFRETSDADRPIGAPPTDVSSGSL